MSGQEFLQFSNSHEEVGILGGGKGLEPRLQGSAFLGGRERPQADEGLLKQPGLKHPLRGLGVKVKPARVPMFRAINRAPEQEGEGHEWKQPDSHAGLRSYFVAEGRQGNRPSQGKMMFPALFIGPPEGTVLGFETERYRVLFGVRIMGKGQLNVVGLESSRVSLAYRNNLFN